MPTHPWDLEGKKEDQGDQVEPEGEPRTWKTNKIILVNSTQSSSKITNVLFWDRSAKSDTELSGNGSTSGGEADAENKEGGEEQLEGLVLPNQRDQVLRQQWAEHQDQSCRDVEQAEGLLLLVPEPVQHGDDLVDGDDNKPVHHSGEEDAEPSGNKADEDSKVAGELLRDVVAEAGKRGLKRKMQQDDHTEGPPTKKIRLSHDLTKSCTQCRRRKRK